MCRCGMTASSLSFCCWTAPRPASAGGLSCTSGRGYRRAFDNFEPARIAEYGDRDTARLLADPEIVRNRQKIAAAIGNAQAFLPVQQEFGSFAAYIWTFVGDNPIKNRWATDADIPATSPESEALSQDLRRRGFRFVGPHHLLRLYAGGRPGQ